MKFAHVVLAVVLANTAFSGCFGLFEKDEAHDHDGHDHGDDSGTPASLPPPPVAAFVVLIDGNLTEAINGTFAAIAGGNVTFDASASTGSNLTFAWDMGDGTTYGEVPVVEDADDNSTDNATGGNETEAFLLPIVVPGFQSNETNETANETELESAAPAENQIVVHAYLEAGTYNVTLYVTDEAGQNATMGATVEVASSGPAPGTWLREDAQAFGSAAGSTTMVNGGCGALFTKEWVLVDVEANGTASKVSVATVTIGALTTTNGASSGGTTKIWFKDPTGKEIKSNVAAGTSAKTLTMNNLPAGKYKVEAQLCAATVAVNVNPSPVSGKATYVAA